MTQTFRRATFVALLTITAASTPLHAQTNAWVPPTPEELSMTSVPQAPGAGAIYLFREETTDDMMRMYSYYNRVKILTEGGKDEANIELPFGGTAGVSLESISARTIHSDGTVIPFTGKPYDKVVEKVEGHKVKQRVFSLPDVTVGSIIEYRYKFHYDDSYFLHPDWFIQSDLFVRKAHFLWKPNHKSNETIVDSKGNSLDRIAWSPILPEGVNVEQVKVNGVTQLELNVSDIQPLPREDYMPPVGSFSYRVIFYYTSYSSAAEFWTKEGKQWSKDVDKFTGPNKGVKEAVNTLITPTDTAEIKLHKIYDTVEALENTSFTRERSSQEDTASGFKAAQSTDDILARKRGGDDQLTLLFVAMARAAGFKAYVMDVTDRSKGIFNNQYLSFRQLDDYIAIVNIDGKERYFDPGQRYCSFGQLAWKHTITGGIRQMDGGATQSAVTPSGPYSQSKTSRIADLVLDEQGAASGTVKLSYTGNPALYWRHEALRGDTTSLNADLKEALERMLPGGMEVKVTGIENLTDPEQPLKVSYEIKGAVGSSTGKRLLVPANLFESNSKPRFPQPKRELTVDMRYPSIIQDAVRFKLPTGVTLETTPVPDNAKLADVAAFDVKIAKAADSITTYRNLIIGKTYFTPTEYPDLRTFYGKLEAKDQETVVLTHASGVAAKSGGASN